MRVMTLSLFECRQFDKLCELMSEENNWQAYRAKMEKYLNNGVQFVPFFGMFLTQVSFGHFEH